MVCHNPLPNSGQFNFQQLHLIPVQKRTARSVNLKNDTEKFQHSWTISVSAQHYFQLLLNSTTKIECLTEIKHLTNENFLTKIKHLTKMKHLTKIKWLTNVINIIKINYLTKINNFTKINIFLSLKTLLDLNILISLCY